MGPLGLSYRMVYVSVSSEEMAPGCLPTKSIEFQLVFPRRLPAIQNPDIEWLSMPKWHLLKCIGAISNYLYIHERGYLQVAISLAHLKSHRGGLRASKH